LDGITLEKSWFANWEVSYGPKQVHHRADIPKVDTFEHEQLRGAAAKSNELPRTLRTGMDETG